MLARLPPHPNMALLDQVVVDEVTGSSIVGFTMRYIAVEPFEESRGVFKLKWLRQLVQTIDGLNLTHGITHQDLAARNLLVDPGTDSIVLIDFNFACRLGITVLASRQSEGRWDGRDDVKGVLIFLYESIPRGPALDRYVLHLVDEKDFLDPAKWIKHPEVELDDDVGKFYRVLMAWVGGSRAGKQLAHFTEAPEHIDWPDRPAHRPARFGVARRLAAGLPFIDWRRPASSTLYPGRRLLDTGRYADEEEALEAKRAAAAAGGATLTTPAPSTRASPRNKAKSAAGAGRLKTNGTASPITKAAKGIKRSLSIANKHELRRSPRTCQSAHPCGHHCLR